MTPLASAPVDVTLYARQCELRSLVEAVRAQVAAERAERRAS